MGLGVSLTNALSGMNVSQNSLDVLSRNVANSGTPGYHRQSLSVIDTNGRQQHLRPHRAASSAPSTRACRRYYTRRSRTRAMPTSAADVLDRLQTLLGKPGDRGLARYAVRSTSRTRCSNWRPARTTMRPRAYGRVAGAGDGRDAQLADRRGPGAAPGDRGARSPSDVDELNQSISLARQDQRPARRPDARTGLARHADGPARPAGRAGRRTDRRARRLPRRRHRGADDAHRASACSTTRRRCSSSRAPARCRPTRSSTPTPHKSGVGTLILHTPSGLAHRSGAAERPASRANWPALIDLRDKTLVQAQSQLDEIAAGLAQAFSTVTDRGHAGDVRAPQHGFDVDIGAIRDGNDFAPQLHAERGRRSRCAWCGSTTPTKLPLDYVDANGTRVIGLDFSGGAAAVAAALGQRAGRGISRSPVRGRPWSQVLDDGAAGTTTVSRCSTARSTATGLQNGELGLNLFVDCGNADFTNTLGGKPAEQLGFAGRIAVNSAIVADNKLLVQYQPGGSLGDAARRRYLVDQLQSMRSRLGAAAASGTRRLPARRHGQRHDRPDHGLPGRDRGRGAGRPTTRSS